MRKPNESLNDFSVKPAPEILSKPPRSVWLQPTGEVDIVKPLLRPEIRPKTAWFGLKVDRPFQPLWFRRFLVAGSVGLVFVAMVLVSAIVVSIGEPAAGPDVATGGQIDDKQSQPEELFSFDLSVPLTLVPENREGVRSRIRRRPARPAIHLSANKPKRQFRPLPQPEEPRFVPTTLVIYAENGVINTRIEPWLQGSDKKPLTFSN
jgi:hypothetical protein